MPTSQQQFDFSRGAQLARLRRLSLPDGTSKDGSTVRSATLLAVLRTLDDRCGKNGEQWWDQATLGKQAGISARTVSKALQVLESMHLISKIDTRRGGARRLVISIDWHTVFGDVEPYQDPTILVAWRLLSDAGEADSNSEVESFNSELSAEFNSEVSSELIRKPVPNSLLSKTPNDPPTLCEGEVVSGSFGIEFTTETRRHGDGQAQGLSAVVAQTRKAVQDCRPRSGSDDDADQAGDQAVDPSVREALARQSRLATPANGSFGIPDREETATNARTHWEVSGGARIFDNGLIPQPSTLNPQRSPPMPTRTIDSREQSLVERLIALDVGSARATLRESLRIGYTVDAIAGILDWYESLIMVDPDTNQRVIPYWPGSLVIRLRDEDARRAEPSQGKWGGKRAEWTALKARLDAKPAAGRVPDQLFARRAALVETLNRSQVIFCLEVLASADGPDVPRAVKCLAWVESQWSEDLNLLIPPPAVFKFLMQFDVEQIMRGGN